jgi:hypothetical protein
VNLNAIKLHPATAHDRYCIDRLRKTDGNEADLVLRLVQLRLRHTAESVRVVGLDREDFKTVARSLNVREPHPCFTFSGTIVTLAEVMP